MKRKCIDRFLDYTCHLDLWPRLWSPHWFFRVKLSVSQELFDWCERKRTKISGILGWLCDLFLWPHPWPWPWPFQGERFDYFYLRNWWADWQGTKGTAVDGSFMTMPMNLQWPQWDGWIYQIVTGVTSDVDVPWTHPVNTLRLRQNGRHFADKIFKCIFLNENVWIMVRISLKFIPKCLIKNNPALVQIMAWRRPGDKPLSEPMMVSLLTHIWVTRSQWVSPCCVEFMSVNIKASSIFYHLLLHLSSKPIFIIHFVLHNILNIQAYWFYHMYNIAVIPSSRYLRVCR